MLTKKNHADAPRRFVGFDSSGEVFTSDGRILRGIYPGKGDLYRQVLRTFEVNNLSQFGIIATHELSSNPYPDWPYDLVLEHERIPFINYPHEWPAAMLKDAALFHINLYFKLGEYGLTIKDWHPYNILFNNTHPTFVDFLSIIPAGDLQQEEYLTPSQTSLLFKYLWDKDSVYFFEMYKRMCEPYFLFPLLMMQNGQYARAHTRIFETTLNASASSISLDELGPSLSAMRMRYWWLINLKKLTLVQRGAFKWWFLKLLRREIEGLLVTTMESAYSSYYAAKGEDFNFTPSPDWNNKQMVVNEAIKCFSPGTLLDIGSNTGWFSILAAKLGCQVVALDIDEACVNELYIRAKGENLPILPLVADLVELTPNLAPHEFKDEPSRSLIGGNEPLLLSADKRLKCDMVLALGLVHHLALGKGLSFGKIAQMLSAFANSQLLVEFVSKSDRLVQSEPKFFPAYDKDPGRFEWYTRENFVKELRKYFREVEIKNSHPDTRTILVCIV